MFQRQLEEEKEFLLMQTSLIKKKSIFCTICLQNTEDEDLGFD